MNDIDIQHDSTVHRFLCEVDGHTGSVEYRREGGVMTILHTDVPEQIGGRGIASRLVRAALDFARAEGLRVVPRCSYTAAWIERHPDYADLRV